MGFGLCSDLNLVGVFLIFMRWKLLGDGIFTCTFLLNVVWLFYCGKIWGYLNLGLVYLSRSDTKFESFFLWVYLLSFLKITAGSFEWFLWFFLCWLSKFSFFAFECLFLCLSMDCFHRVEFLFLTWIQVKTL